ncbi:hypothetical protein [Kerstersia sp.]|uniref:hypothetical protein n=1 Tax=Kerstersia sp. TaxID=1930783 RepID=UPI003F9287DA
MDAQFGQGYGLVLGTVLLAIVAFWVALMLRRAGARQDTDDSGCADHGSENTDADDEAVDQASESDDSDGSDSAGGSAPAQDAMQARRLELARQKFEQQLSAIDLDLDAPSAADSAQDAERPGQQKGSR